MPNLSDIIEQFILQAIGKEDYIEIGRNELANHFLCAPSQINYVLSTRFTMDRGYIIDSRRGGGGYIVVTKLKDDCLSYINELLGTSNTLSLNACNQIVDRLVSNDIIGDDEASIMRAAVSDKSLNSPFNIADNLRASIMREIMLRLMHKTRKI